MTLKTFKARLKGMGLGADDYAAAMVDRQAGLQEDRLKKYMLFVGVGLIFSGIYWLLSGNVLLGMLALCTAHLQIVINYKFKKLAGLPQWNVHKKEVQN